MQEWWEGSSHGVGPCRWRAERLEGSQWAPRDKEAPYCHGDEDDIGRDHTDQVERRVTFVQEGLKHKKEKKNL